MDNGLQLQLSYTNAFLFVGWPRVFPQPQSVFSNEVVSVNLKSDCKSLRSRFQIGDTHMM